MLHSVLSRALLLVAALLSVFANAGATDIVLTHQGRLLSSSDEPVNGPVDITFRIFDVPTGGTALWTELHSAVPVADGLFSTTLGSITPMSSDVLASAASTLPRWLEVVVSGVPIVPRVLLASTPSSAVSTRVLGDIQTEPGILTVSNAIGTKGIKTRVSNTDNGIAIDEEGVQVFAINSHNSPGDGHVSMAVGDLTGDGRADLVCTSDSVKSSWTFVDAGSGSSGGVELMSHAVGSNWGAFRTNSGGDLVRSSNETDDNGARAILLATSADNSGTAMMEATPDSAVSILVSEGPGPLGTASANFTVIGRFTDHTTSDLTIDADGDGLPESSVQQESRPGGATMKAIQTKGTGAIASVKMETADSTGIIAVSDLDGDGNPEARASTFIVEEIEFVTEKVERASMIDPNDDGIPESAIQETCSLGGTTMKAIQTKGTGAIASVKMEASDSTGIIAVSDLDGDGNPEASMRGTLTGVAPGSSNRSAQYLDVDNDDDGIPESSLQMESRSGGVTMKAIQTKGTGAIASVRMDAGDSAGVTAISDIDGDGHSDASFQIQARDQFGNMVLAVDTDDNGVSDNSLVSTCDASGVKIVLDRDSGRSKGSMEMEQNRSTLKTHFETSDMLVHSNVVVETDSGGANLSLSRSSDGGNHTDGWNVYAIQGMNGIISDIDDDDDGNAEAQYKLSIISGDIGFIDIDSRMSVDSDDDGVADVSADMEVSADSATFRLNALPPGIPVIETISMTASLTGVHMEVGAATCDGTNWVNASDKNAKENFEKVDGGELLDKIAGLDITKWNYKSDKETEHIGPTAQDFKETFGVGSDGKSISTIDPSGIALAAIKELYAQLSELQKRNKEYDAQVQERDAQLKSLQGELKRLREEMKKTNN